jgi:hypothetical protein
MLWGTTLAHFSGGEVAAPILENMVELIYLILKRMKFSLKVFQE